jgi:hypothetical protein
MYMKNSTRLYSIAVLVFFLAALFSCHKEDESPAYPNKGYLVFTGDASSRQMVPAVADSLTGTAQFYGVYDMNSQVFNYKLSWYRLKSNADTANFYGPALGGQVGVATRNIFNLAVSATRPVTDSITGVIWMYSKLTDAELADLKAGKWYYTISTANIAGGEVRGQISYQRTF